MMCRSKIFHNVKQDNPTIDSFYLDTIHDTEGSTIWMTDVKVNNISVTFKVDTGAEITAVSESTLQTLGQLEVSMPDKKLCGPNGVLLDLRGSLTVTLSQKQHKCDQEIFVIKQLKHNPLGLPAIKGLHLLSVLDNKSVTLLLLSNKSFKVYLQGWEYSKVIMRSRSSQMLSLSHLALLETYHYLFVIR